MPQNDFNGDGRSDVLWRHDDGTVGNWLANESGGFAINDASLVTVPNNWQIVGAADFDGDDCCDLLWRNQDGTLGVWFGTETGVFHIADSSLVNVPTDWVVVGTGDFDGDGCSDILWRNNDGTIGNWLGTEDGSFTINNSSLVNVPNYWQVIGTGDFDGDGRDDILWQSDNGYVGNWLGTDSGVFLINDTNSLFDGAYWGATNPIGIGDFNGDGRDDILFREGLGQLFSLESAPGGSFYPAWFIGYIHPLPDSSSVEAVGDFDRDGRDDMLWRNADGSLTTLLSSGTGGLNGYVFSPAPVSQVRVPEEWQIDYWL